MLLFALCLTSLRQAQVEKTMNLSMAAQTILAKYPAIDQPQSGQNNFGDNPNSQNGNKVYSKYFKSVFDLVNSNFFQTFLGF